MRHWYSGRSAAKIERKMNPITDLHTALATAEDPEAALALVRDMQDQVASLQRQLMAEVAMWRHAVADEVEGADPAEEQVLVVRLPGGTLGVAK